MVPIAASILVAALAGQPQCLSSGGAGACGYHCLADYGQVRCAKTAAGACSAGYGQVVCWDPPRWVLDRYGTSMPEATCLAEGGRIACGYNCLANNGQVRCAQTPDGLCRFEAGKVACFESVPEEALAGRPRMHRHRK